MYPYQFNTQSEEKIILVPQTVYIAVEGNIYKQWNEGQAVPTDVYNRALPSLLDAEGKNLVESKSVSAPIEVAPIQETPVEEPKQHVLDETGNTVEKESGELYLPELPTEPQVEVAISDVDANEKEIEPGPPQEAPQTEETTKTVSKPKSTFKKR